ncbi:MAG: hypothetical protein JXR63_04480 [Spirochaetales bacterium]|nr:hypothetical protein [Spirochaetales bacterium]
MKKKDFMFAIGFRDDIAIIDKNAVAKYSKYSFEQLLEEGLFKPAFCEAVFEEDSEKVQAVIDAYNQKSGSNYKDKLQISRLFGVFSVPEDGVKTKYL